jgi:D-cysteine desulfhydrase
LNALDSSELRQRVDRFPRCRLGVHETPLVPLPRLSRALERPVYLKRDDELGPGLGGNKTRKLEFLLAEALEVGANKVATYGGLQSNHARITAAAARCLGLEPHLFYFERRPPRLTGNLVVNRLTGAHMHFIPLGGRGHDPRDMDRTNRLVRWVARLRIGRHYFVPVGGHSWRGCMGYVRAAAEIDEQARGLGIEGSWLVTAVGTGGTLAGLMAGLSLIGSSLRVVGIDVGRLWRGFPTVVARMASELCARLGEARSFRTEDVPLVEERYVGARYGVPSPGGRAAILRLARTEGVLLDPIYTGKAFAGLLGEMERGQWGEGDPVIFLHTGGYPGLFAFSQGILPDD